MNEQVNQMESKIFHLTDFFGGWIIIIRYSLALLVGSWSNWQSLAAFSVYNYCPWTMLEYHLYSVAFVEWPTMNWAMKMLTMELVAVDCYDID